MSVSRGGRLLIVGNAEPTHVGAHLVRAARALGLVVTLCDTREAYAGPWLVNKVNWWLRGRRPTRLTNFSRWVVAEARSFGPDWVLATGLAPLSADALDELGKTGVRRLNFLTDDPWNPSHHAPWFLEALSHYDQVFSPRRSNLTDLSAAGCGQVAYLPFAYCPETHFPVAMSASSDPDPFDCDVMFAGGADRDRVPYLTALIKAGYRVGLYGGFWDRYRPTRASSRGHLDAAGMRQAVRAARVVLCLVRRANRDGHVMRTFEVPAMGGCMLAEHTAEHEEILGKDGEAVVYFRDIPEMAARLRRLLDHDEERSRLAEAARRRVVEGSHTYRDRLQTMLTRQRADARQVRRREQCQPEAAS
jgi:hypothetical protein